MSLPGLYSPGLPTSRIAFCRYLRARGPSQASLEEPTPVAHAAVGAGRCGTPGGSAMRPLWALTAVALRAPSVSAHRNFLFCLDSGASEWGDWHKRGGPVFDATGSVVVAVSLSGIVTQLSDVRLPLLAEIVCTCAATISARLGHHNRPGCRPRRPAKGTSGLEQVNDEPPR